MIKETLTIACLVIGTFFMVVAALGVVRFPDLYMRMSASTKSTTFGSGFMLLAGAIYFSDDFGVAARALAVIGFLFLTAPVGAHMIGRAGYLSGAKLWDRSVVNELEGRYTASELLSSDASNSDSKTNESINPQSSG
jgi:multicomponent Na+:H+ antiporter subunit G